MANTMEFSRGDGAYHTFSIPASSWTAGGKLFFAAKPAIDDDTTDAAAAIQGSWTDADLLADVVIGGITYKKYNCHFPASATSSIVSGGAASADYLGEFQFVPASGDPMTFPAKDPKITTTIYFDVKRKTT